MRAFLLSGVHPTALVEAGARLGPDVRIGPYCLVGQEVELADGVVLHSHVVVTGRTSIGLRTQVFPFASLGHPPQDLKYQGEPSRLVIGSDNIIREHVTMNPGTAGGGLLTEVGDHCLFMVGSHVAHDCRVGNRVILANNATLAGHVEVGDNVIIGGLSAVHQHVRIGDNAMIGGMSGIENDVIPYGLAMGERARLAGLNLVGLKRRGFSKAEIRGLLAAYRALFDGEGGSLLERVESLSAEGGLLQENGGPAAAALGDILAFLKADAARAICRPKETHG